MVSMNHVIKVILPLVILGSAVNAMAQYTVAYSQDEDTEFGEFLYNEASQQTQDEILNLLEDEDSASDRVFLHALSMGLGIDEVLDAAIRSDDERGREFTRAAASLLPYVSDVKRYAYAHYELEDLSEPFSIKEVIERFFDNRQTLSLAPDWDKKQIHFYASARELMEVAEQQGNATWYHSKSVIDASADRPVFVSLYEATQTVLIDNKERVAQALNNNSEATLPIVFIFNRLSERAVDQLSEYPSTIRGIQEAYLENSLMVTPTPEWEKGEYHIYADMDEVIDIFDIPQESDFEPEDWQALLSEVQAEKVEDTSFLIVILASGNESDSENRERFANDKDERDPNTLRTIMNDGMVLNRADKIAALASLGVTEIPIAFYYIDENRVKPYRHGLRGLKLVAINAGMPANVLGINPGYNPQTPGGGGFGAPPPEVEEPPAEPPVTPEPPRPPKEPDPKPPMCASPPCNP